YNLAKKKDGGYKYRNIINIMSTLELEKKINDNPIAFVSRQKPLFDFLSLDKDKSLTKQDYEY
ncbi:MAG: hypothetical protein NT145_03650, partial [Elusimicrobia bacterium]|nr:hypothetical protein [Elusimicrobiota bacterium]